VGSKKDVTVPAQPFWEYHFFPHHRSCCSAVVSPVTPQGKVAILISQSIFVLSLSQRPEGCSIVKYPIDGVAGSPRHGYAHIMGTHHALWVMNRYRESLLTCSFFIDPRSWNGVQRLGDESHIGVRLKELHIPLPCKSIGSIAWDEESGRLCVIHRRKPRNSNRIFIVDLI
jgi:hypothetical protein